MPRAAKKLLAAFRSKLSAQRGETLAEVLVAILISSLGMLMLASAISSAYSIVRQGRTAVDELYTREAILADLSTGSPGSVSVTRSLSGVKGGSETESINVKYKSVAGCDVVAYEVVSP